MALIVKRAADHFPDRLPREEELLVISGRAVVGSVARISGGLPSAGKWQWAVNVPIPDGAPAHGIAGDVDTARQQLIARWRKWLDWAGLREIDP